MINRILVALPPLAGTASVYGCASELARMHGATATGVVSIDRDAWKTVLPDPMSASFAARMLEAPPWEHAIASIQDLEAEFLTFCQNAGVNCAIHRPEGNPLPAIAQLACFYDVLIVGLPPVLDQQSDAVLEAGLRRGGGSGIPVLRPAPAFNGVDRVLLLLTKEPGSMRALRNFVQLKPWPSAQVSLASVGTDISNHAVDYCASHGIAPAAGTWHFKDEAEFLTWMGKYATDLVVTGWSFHASMNRGDFPLSRSVSLFVVP